MSIIKHSSRTLREKDKSPKTCRECGEAGFYWAHDTSVYSDPCDNANCATSGKWVLINANPTTRAIDPGTEVDPSHIHNMTCSGKGAAPVAAPVPVVTPEPVSKPLPVTPPAPTTPDTSDAVREAIRTLSGAFAAPVDAAEVDRIITERLAGIVFPTVTVYEPVQGEPKRIDGAHDRLPTVLKVLGLKRHVMMVGPAGTGKSFIARQAAEAMELPFRSIACSPMMMPTALLGYRDANGVYHGTPFRECFENGGLFLFDEIDNSNPSILAAMNEALANGETAFGDGTVVKAHPDFRCIAAANTFGRGADKRYVGRQSIDASTSDRFIVMSIEYDEKMEDGMCRAYGLPEAEVTRVLKYGRKLRSNVFAKDMRAVVSVRGTSAVCDLIAAGITWAEAWEMAVFKGMTEQDKITIGA